MINSSPFSILKNSILIIFTLGVICIISFPLHAQNIIQWRGDNRDGIYNETGLMKKWTENGPKILWHFDELGKGYSSPIITPEKIFITGMINGKGNLFALDLNGKLLWKTEYGTEWDESYPGTRTTPTLYDNKLYINSSYGLAICFDAASGKILWSVDLMKAFKGTVPKWGIAESPLVFDDKVVFSAGGEDANIVALNKENGQTIWTSKGKGDKSAYCSPHLITHNGNKLLITMTADHILGIDPQKGDLIWSYEKKNKWSVHPNTPIYKDGLLYCVSGYGSGGVMLKLSDDGKSVSLVWKNETLDNQMGGVVLLEDKIYGSGHNNVEWHVLDWKTGNEKFKTKEIAKGTIIASDGMLYVYSDKGELGLLQPTEAGFNIVSRVKITLGAEQHWAHPVIKNGIFYVRHGNVLIAYSVK